MLTYPKLTMRVRRMPMHLSSGHVTLMPGKFPPSNFPQSDLGRRADSRWALPQSSSLLLSNLRLCFMHTDKSDVTAMSERYAIESVIDLAKTETGFVKLGLTGETVSGPRFAS